MRVATIGRDEFISSRFHYQNGEHVTFLAPTGGGKTTLAYDLLSQVATQNRPAVSMVMKPRDATVRKYAKQLGHQIVNRWPPPAHKFYTRPPGWILWPKHRYDFDVDNANLYKQFRSAILRQYKRGNSILFADETYGLTAELGLDRECIGVWSRGRSMGTGLWAATQKPSHVPLWAYNQATHLFLAFDPDKRNRDRLREIGGVDPQLVSETLLELGEYQWLYICQKTRTMCIVDKN